MDSKEQKKHCHPLPQKVKFEVPIILACYGMRRSEIGASQVEDVDGDVVHISRVMVQNVVGEWETDHVMKSVYRHSKMEKEELAKRDAAEKLRNVLFS